MQIAGRFIKYILIIVAILGIVFLGQQAFVRGIGENVISRASAQIMTYVAKGSNWALSAVIPTFSGGVKDGKEAITNGIAREKEKISESVGEKITNYFSGITDSILHPGENNNCLTQPTETTPSQ